ncbi:MAG: MBOAT family protein [Alphaproteobacteria bacterium]|nr:MBOAT family protein [Alphaproteobacteria bacterium]
MVFSSYDFLFIFLPCALIFYYTAAFFFKRDEIKFLVLLLFSVLFYGMWKFQDLYIISISIILNYLIGRSLLKKRSSIVLSIGVLLNLLGLGYFKYRYFLAGIFVDGFSSEKLVLPLAISFFTFQQIAWIVDIYRGDKRVPDIIKYSTFVTFFPQLIAGPIVRFSDIAEQYEKLLTKKRAVINIVIGFSYFCIGLAKKVIIADRFAVLADIVFSRAQSGEDIGMLAAWLGVLAYTFQIYFDFSGYSDMAIGLGRMFGIKLPVNFFSPYKSKNIVEFWRRWHITLSSFLRDYLYIPLGGGRKSIWGG